MTPFAVWLDEELRKRHLTRPQLAAYTGAARQTINAWFVDERLPTPELCSRIATVLHVPPEEVLVRAGHLPADTVVAQPDVPGWLTAALVGLTEAELRVVATTARALREARQDLAADEALRAASEQRGAP